MASHECTFDFKGRFFTLGSLTPDTKQIWFVLHGYGQLAEYFIRKFNALENQQIYIIAPEGLSRFYRDQRPAPGHPNDRVGATWMTKENRNVDIENYIRYLNTVYEHIGARNNLPVTVLGFSQGAATASRWIADGRIQFRRLILWSGVFPPDMTLASAKTALHGKDICFVYGTSDPFLTDRTLEALQETAGNLDVKPSIITFNGKHEIDEKTLLTLA